MNVLNLGDFIDLYIKIHQRGVKYILSKINPSASLRTQSTFDDIHLETSHWWVVPAIKQRWNKLITGNEELSYENYFINKFLVNHPGNIRMLSVGCGGGAHEMRFALDPKIEHMLGLDIADQQLAAATKLAEKLQLQNKIQFLAADFNEFPIDGKQFDIILFHQSLHHFKNLDQLIPKVKSLLNKDGFLVLNEYVGPARCQWQKDQLTLVNHTLKNKIPIRFRQVFQTNIYKHKVRRPGILRMVMNDPSEAPESNRILPLIREHFLTVEETGYGGNILMPLLKDISHHFCINEEFRQKLLQELFKIEDNFLLSNPPDFIFGVYRKT